MPDWPIERLRRLTGAEIQAETPFALIVREAGALRLTAVNGAARQAGITVGMALADARAAVPALKVRPAELDADARALTALADWLGRYGPARNVDGVDGAWVDITGVAHLFGGEAGLCRDLANRLGRARISVRIGLADTLGSAHALARFGARHGGDGLVIAPAGETRGVLATLPVAALRLGADAVRLLTRLGLKRIGQLYGLPRTALAARFRETRPAGGRRGAETAAAELVLRLDQALGHVSEPRAPLVPPAEATRRLDFPDPLLTAEGITAALERLAAGLGETLGAQGLGGRRFTLALYRSDATAARVTAGTRSPSRDPIHLCRLLGEKITQLDAGFGVDTMTLEADGLTPLADRQTGLAADDTTLPERIDALVDRLVGRLGRERVLVAGQQASHLPERAAGWRPALDSDTPPPKATAPTCSDEPSRPALLLTRPEAIAVIAALPEGAPQRFVWRRVARRIVRSEGPERIAPEWWRHIGTGRRPPRTRDYYRLEDQSGARYWVFREGLYDMQEDLGDESSGDDVHEAADEPRWFLHGLFA